jgi:asparagine N-glycosylation enzyme membrane subunit Stt3
MRVVITPRFLAGFVLLMVALFLVALAFPSFDPIWMTGSMLGLIFIGLCAIALVDWLVRMARR